MTDNVLELSTLTTDYDDFVSQFNTWLANTSTWKGTLTTQTSQTLVQLISAVGAFLTGRMYRVYEDAYAETAQSDDAIRSIVQMQGIRLARYLPSQITATLTSPVSVSLAPLTQFSAGSLQFFNRDQLQLVANTPLNVTLFEGVVTQVAAPGTGTELQSFVSQEGGFVISDLDVLVRINGVAIPKSLGGLWNYKGLPAYTDLTLPDGRLLIQFGDQQFGAMPGTNDVATITYAVTQGESGNNQNLSGKTLNTTGFSAISGTVLTNPTGGANDKPIVAYKNVASGSFGTYLSAVTKSQYQSIVIGYPGIVDAFTQAQREINPTALEWMNVIRVSGLTTSPWSAEQKKDFCDYAQTVTMYAPHFVWNDPIAIPRDVDVEVYVFNTATPSEVQAKVITALQALFAIQPGILMTNLYLSDIIETCRAAAPGLVSYVIVNNPTGPMIVTAPPSPSLTYTLLPNGGTLSTFTYAYGVSTVLATGEEGTPSNWVFPQIVTTGSNYGLKLEWPAVSNAQSYKIWGRKSAEVGLLATVDASTLSWTDDGSATPGIKPPNALLDIPIRYNSLRNLNVFVDYAERQQRMDSTPQRLIAR